jgi:energy-coupling factor transporter transmembrane protein EcfT
VRLALLLALAGAAIAVPPAVLASGLAILFVAAARWLPAAQLRYLVRFAIVTLLLASFFYAAFGPGPSQVRLGPFGLNGADFATGLLAALRLTAVFGLFALAGRFLPARDLLPYVARAGIPAYLCGALLRLVPQLRADAAHLRDAQAVRGHAPGRGLRAARSWIPLVVPLFVRAMHRARDQALALHLAGLARDGRGAPGARAHFWATAAALAALAVAGRLLLISLPGISLGFFVLFIAGAAYGPRVGATVGVLSRVTTDLILSGLNPVLLPMALVEAILGLVAGLLGRLVNLGQREREPWAYAGFVAGTAGWAFTAAFSLLADTANWLVARWLLPNLDPGAAEAAWLVFAARGLVFNLPSMAFNAVLFAVAAYPTLRALHHSGALPGHGPAYRASTWRHGT